MIIIDKTHKTQIESFQPAKPKYSPQIFEQSKVMKDLWQLEQAVIYQLGYLCKLFFVPELGQAVKKENLSLSKSFFVPELL